MHCVIWAGGSISQMVGASSESVRECFAWWEAPSAGEIDYLEARDHPIGSMWHVPVEKLRKLQQLRERVLDPLAIRTGTSHGLVLAHNRAHVVGMLSLYPQGDHPADPDVRPLLGELTPFLVHATLAQRYQGAVSATSAGLRRSIDRLRIGVVMLDRRNRVIFANSAACERLEEKEAPAYLATSAMPARRKRIDAALTGLLDASVNHSGPAVPHVSIARLAPPGQLSTFLGAATVVFIPDPQVTETELVEPLRKTFGLTPAEARLAALLASDYTLDEAAAYLGLTVGTVRTRLKRLFEKTGTNRQASLVRKLITHQVFVSSDD